MAWLLLVLAGLLEVGFALSLKASDGFRHLVPSLLFVAFAAASFTLLNLALRTLPVGTAYAVWTGVGAAGTAVIGMVVLGDAASVARIASVVLILAGVVGLNLSAAAAQ